MQNAVFPAVALFVSTLLVVVFKPRIFIDAAIIGKIVVLSLFIAGVIHIIGRIRDGFEHYTYDDESLHESILDENEPKIKPYSRSMATVFLLTGLVLSFGIGYLIGSYRRVSVSRLAFNVFRDVEAGIRLLPAHNRAFCRFDACVRFTAGTTDRRN